MSGGGPDVRDLLDPIRRIHERVRDAVVRASEQAEVDQLAEISDDESQGDTIYAIDRVSEELLVQLFAEELAQTAPLVLIAEGIEDGKLVLPVGATESDAIWRVIVDPIDGTRGLMYQKKKRLGFNWRCTKSWRRNKSPGHRARGSD